MAGRRTAALTLVTLLALGSTPALAAPRLTAVDRVYAHTERSLKALGVYHLVTVDRGSGGGQTTVTRTEEWVDASQGVARSITSNGVGGKPRRELIAGGVAWEDGRPTSPVTCHGVGAAAGTVLGCPQIASSHLVPGRYKGRSTHVLVTHSTIEGENETIKMVTLLTLDLRTALPLTGTYTGTREAGVISHFHGTVTFTSERLKRSSLPRSFFSPAALGWHLPDPAKGLPHGLPLYWLGKSWSPGSALPDLVLQGVERLKSSQPHYQEILQYALAADPYGPDVLTVEIWKPADWTAAKVETAVPLCRPQSQLVLADGTATFYCPAGGDGDFASIDLPGAHVAVNSISYGSIGGGVAQSPFNTIDALSTAIEALEVRP